MLNGLHALRARDLPGVATIIVGDRLRAQVLLHAPLLLSAAAADDVTIPFGTVGSLGIATGSDVDARDVVVRVLARAENAWALVLAVAVVTR